ncbi:hypothetical protein JA1_003570 [Spathaspora sp. JA1]|nr:hypothetical protein JA1_003570 [Spathaspora sp. JA1]
MLLYVPSLYIYQPEKTTYIFTDASDYAIAGFLTQAHHIKGKELLVPIAFARYKLTDTQSRYSALEKELAAITILENRSLPRGMYGPKVFYLPGKLYFMADILSRYQTNHIKEFIDEASVLRKDHIMRSKPSKGNKAIQLSVMDINNLNDKDIQKIREKLEEDITEAEDELTHHYFNLGMIL